MMKNSASNLVKKQASEKQALKIHAEQLLPKVTNALLSLDYEEISHQRLSQQRRNVDVIYQGITQAKHNAQNNANNANSEVMIKWEVSANNLHDSIGLTNEIANTKALVGLQQQKKLTALTPHLLADNTVTIGLNEKQQLTYFVMPYYSRGSLAVYLQNTLNSHHKLELIIQAAKIIAHLHDNGWLHNDIKPSNMLLRDSTTSHKKDSFDLLLIDFALAQLIENVSPESINKEIFNAGTPAYLAPERWQGQSATLQSDIYAFGVTMYEILIGAKPFNIKLQSDDLAQEWAIQHCQQPIPILPSAFGLYQTIIDKAFAKKVENRYANMHDILEDLQSIIIKQNLIDTLDKAPRQVCR